MLSQNSRGTTLNGHPDTEQQLQLEANTKIEYERYVQAALSVIELSVIGCLRGQMVGVLSVMGQKPMV